MSKQTQPPTPLNSAESPFAMWLLELWWYRYLDVLELYKADPAPTEEKPSIPEFKSQHDFYTTMQSIFYSPNDFLKERWLFLLQFGYEGGKQILNVRKSLRARQKEPATKIAAASILEKYMRRPRDIPSSDLPVIFDPTKPST